MSRRKHTVAFGRLVVLWSLLACACSKGAGDAHPGGPSAAGGDPASRPVPVVAAAASTQDVPIYLDGLGSVSAYKTVVVHSQVDGRLQDVYFKEGQTVRKGDVLAQVDPRPFQAQLQQAEGALARDSAALVGSKLNLERYATLKNEKLVGAQQVDDQKAVVGQQEGAVRMDQGQVQNARLQIEYARITSPIDGVTGIRQVDPGNLVQKTDANGIVTITQIDPIAVLFTLPQDDLPRIAQAVAEADKEHGLKVDVFGRDGDVLLASGELLVIDNQINSNTATVRLKAIFQNPQRKLWPNQFVKARLQLQVRRGALVIPMTAIQRGPKGTFVYVISGDQTATPRPIVLEQSAGDLALLKAGVKAGEKVVVDGQNQLRPGSKVVERQPQGGDRGSTKEGGHGAPKQDGAQDGAPPAGSDHPGGQRGGTAGAPGLGGGRP